MTQQFNEIMFLLIIFGKWVDWFLGQIWLNFKVDLVHNLIGENKEKKKTNGSLIFVYRGSLQLGLLCFGSDQGFGQETEHLI